MIRKTRFSNLNKIRGIMRHSSQILDNFYEFNQSSGFKCLDQLVFGILQPKVTNNCIMFKDLYKYIC